MVTGGSGDIGAAICVALAEAGCDIALTYVGNTDGAEETAAQVVATGRTAHQVQLDQRDETSIDAAVANVIATFGQCDVLVNNAAWNIGIPFKQLQGRSTATRGIASWRPTCERAVPAQPGDGRPPPRGRRRTDRQHRLRRRAQPRLEQHRLLVLQGRTDPPDPLPGRRPGPGDLGELRRPRLGRGNPHGAAPARRGLGRGPPSGRAGHGRQRGGHRRRHGAAVPRRHDHRPDHRRRRRDARGDELRRRTATGRGGSSRRGPVGRAWGRSCRSRRCRSRTAGRRRGPGPAGDR